MKKLFFLSIIFIVSISAYAQKKQRSTLITLPTYTTRMLSDSLRKTTAKILLLEKKIDSISNVISTAGAYLSGRDFQVDSVTKVITIKQRIDTIIIFRGTAQRAPGLKSMLEDSRKGILGMGLTNGTLPQNSYTIGTQNLSKEQIDIQDLKWQVKYLFSVIDSMQDIIDQQQRKEDYN